MSNLPDNFSRKFAHIAISVSDMKKSQEFYKELLGLSKIGDFRIDDQKLRICLINKDDITIELFCFENHSPLPDYRKDLNNDLKTLGTKHFAITSYDIDKDYARIKSIGIEPYCDIIEFQNGAKYFFVKDPDNNFVEFFEE